MPVVLEISDAHKSYGGQVLLDGAALTVTDAMRVGLVGRNGCGKSTLCRAILGQEALDVGSVSMPAGVRLAYLEQHDDFGSEETVLDYLMRRSARPDWRCAEIAARFALVGDTLVQPVRRLSGGWQTRAKIGAMLLQEPDLLLLDEPTNFLDLRTQLLLERFLGSWRGAALIVSHDRAFLKATCTHTCELSRGRLTLFPGDVDAFYAEMAERQAQAARSNAGVSAKARQLQTFIDQNRANANTASQARSKAKQLARLQDELVEIQSAEATLRMAVPEVPARKGTALRCDALRIGYEDHTVATGIDLEIERGTHLAVVGDNGQGKTTLLRTLSGDLPPLAGSVRWTHGAELGVYGQHVFGTLPEQRSVLDYLHAAAPPGPGVGQAVLAMAGSFLFRGDDVRKRIGVLSGGERARLVLAGLLLRRHTVLVLDEPTNHLDVETVGALADALSRYNGTVLFVSHDRRFIASVATGVVEVRDGRVAHFPGDFATYCYRVERELDGGRDAPTADGEGSEHTRKQRARRLHELGRQLVALEQKVARLDARRRRLEQDLAAAGADLARAQRVHDEVARVSAELAEAEQAWFAAQEAQAKLQG